MLPSRAHALAVAFLAAAFMIGGVAGWYVNAWSTRGQRRSRDPEAVVAYLTQQLALSAGQQDSVRTVLDRRRMDMDAIWLAARPRVDSLRRTMQTEIEEELTPPQRKRFRELGAWQLRQRRAADSASLELWDADHDGVPYWLDKCRDTPPDTPVDTTGCATRMSRSGGGRGIR